MRTREGRGMSLDRLGSEVRWTLRWPTDRALLCLPSAAASARGGVAAALALEPALAALAELERWLGEGLEAVEPADVASESWPEALAAGAETAGAAASLTLPLLAAPGARIELPLSLLPFGRPAPPELVADWPRVQVQATLQDFAADAFDASELREGALLLLPDAFAPAGLALRFARPHWPTLRCRPWRPAAADDDNSAVACALERGAAPDREAWQLQWREPVWLPASAWFGEPARLPAVPGRLVLRGPGPHEGEGELLPLGAGWGLRIAALHEAHPAQ